jgi:cytochrome c553
MHDLPSVQGRISVLKKIGIILGVLLGLVVVVAAAGVGVASSRTGRTWAIDPRVPPIPTDSASIARGQHLGTAITKCVECHGEKLEGHDVIPEGPLGLAAAPNLTRGKGGLATTLTDVDWVRAVRHGIGRDHRALLIMPSDDFVYLGDEDLAAVIAWAKSVPAVDNERPTSHLNTLGKLLYGAGKLPLYSAERIDHADAPRTAPPVAPTVEYGKYIANVGGCTGCHGPGLSGGPIPGTPPEFKPAANLTPTGIGTYKDDDIVRILREGMRPGGSKIDDFMPWKATKLMTDDEMTALIKYLRTVPPKAYGGR